MKSEMKRLLFFMFFAALTTNLAGNTFLFQTGFEEEDAIKNLILKGWKSTLPFDKPVYWPEGVKAELVTDVFFTGSKALMLHSVSPERVVNISTPFLNVKEGSKIKISAAMKIQQVVTGEKGWYKARLGYGICDKDFNPVKGGFKSFAEEEGTRDWTMYEIVTVTPPGSEHISVYMELKNCRGTAWFDDIKIELAREGSFLSDASSNEQAFSASEPIVIPKPWKERYGGNFIPLEKVALIADSEETAKTELIEFIKSLTGNPPPEKQQADDSTLVLMGAPGQDPLKKYMQLAGLSIDWKELGEQGYVVYAGTVADKKTILLAGFSPESRFYALQTLKQLAVKKNGRNYVHEGLVIDRPLYKIRGAVFGDLRRWYDGPPQRINGKYQYSGWPYRERFHKLKLNFIWLAGWGSDHYARQVFPLNERDKQVLEDFLKDCKKYFITPSVGLRPYRQLPHPGREKGGVIYSSEEDIEGVVSNLVTMYGMGYRDLFITFDDLPSHRFLEYEQDKKRFKSIGDAHLYYIGEVYKRLKKTCTDVNFRVIGVAYGGGAQMSTLWKEYLRDISSLPKEIEFVFTSAGSSDADYSSSLSGGRKIIIWSNYYAGLYEKLAQVPVIVNPYEGGDSTLHQHTTGHFVLFVDLPNEDTAHISWYTASDYMWNPSAYKPEDSAKRALVKSVGYEPYQLLQEYTKLTHEIGDEGIQGTSGKERIDYIKQVINELDGYADKLKNTLAPEFYQPLVDQSVRYKEFLTLLRQEYDKKPFPVMIKKCTLPPVIDGNLDDECWSKTSPVSNFLNLRENSPAELQTVVYLIYDDQNLYLGAKMEEPETAKLKAVFTERDSSVFIDDSLEMFLGSFDNPRNYRHIAINSLGTIYDAKEQYEGWNGKYKIITSKKENAWIIEMAVPWENFDFPRTDLLRFNFTRNRYAGGKREHTTYALLFGSGFHLPQWFWVLHLNLK